MHRKGTILLFLTNVMFWIKQRLNLLSWVPLCKTAKQNKKPSRPALWHRFLFKCVCTQSLTASSFFLTDRREAVLLPSLQQGVRRQVQPQGSPTDPLGCEKIPMQELLQNLLQDVSSAQAWGIWVLCSTLTELGYFLFFFPPPSSEKKNKTNCCFFMFSEPGRAVRESHRGGGGSFFLFFFCFFFLFCVFFFLDDWSVSFQSSVGSCASRLKQCFCDCNQCRALSCHVLTYLCYSCTFSACLECWFFFHMPSQCYPQCFCTDVSHWLLCSPPLPSF